MEISQRKRKSVNWHVVNKESVQFITAMLVGNSFCLVVYGFFAGKFITDSIQIHWITSNALLSLLAQVLISTPIIILMAEFLPKLLGYRYNRATLKILMPAAFWIYRSFKFLGINALTSSISNAVLRRGSNGEVPDLQNTQDDRKKKFQDLLQAEEGVQPDLRMLMQMSKKTLGFDKLRVRDCMIPSVHIKALEVSESAQALQEKFAETGLSRIIIYERNMDKVLGYAHTFDMIKQTPKDIRSILIHLPRFFETVSVKEALKQLTASQKSIALVMDEYGNTSGLVGVEDMIEQIFGEIKDEHDELHERKNKEVEVRRLSKGEYIVQARIKLEDLNALTGLNLPTSEEYETLAGLILHSKQDIPKNKERLTLYGVHIEILKATHSAIHQVALKVE